MGKELSGEFGIGFFAEALHLDGRMFACQTGDVSRLAALDVAVRRAGPGRADADGDEPVGRFRRGEGVAHDRVIGGGVLDELAEFAGDFDGAGDGADGVELQLVGEDEDVFKRNQPVEAADRLLEERSMSEKIEKLLWSGIPAQWPETGSRPSGARGYA